MTSFIVQQLLHYSNQHYRPWANTKPVLDANVGHIIYAFSAVVAICVLLARLCQPLLPYRPRWTKPFIEELSKHGEILSLGHKMHYSRLSATLLVLVPASLALQVATVVFPSITYAAILQLIALAIATLLTTVDRPKTAPIGLLAIFTGFLLAQIVSVLSGTAPFIHLNNIIIFSNIFLSLVIIGTIFCMPLRDVKLPNSGISPAFDSPTHQLRSPEDNLTLLQFMTVSWMSPLISLGSARQLNDEDVWSLSLEFQHRLLHDRFRELKGSVVRRLLAANGLDIVLITTLSIIESAARFAAPVLLQQLLRSMEDPEIPRANALTYAIISLIARLIATQSSVLNLWFSRRCYERSRGEMITMIFEKTLDRKIIGSVKHSPACKSFAKGDPINLSKAKHPTTLRGGWWRASLSRIKRVFNRTRAAKEEKEPAAMGKILNLMRNDVYEVAQRFWEAESLITKPLGLVVSVVLIWRLIGWPCLFGVLTVLIAQAINALITKALLGWERRRRKATDIKLQKISQFVEAIRHLRWYGWQDYWQEQIMVARQHELNLRIVTRLWSIMISFTNTFASGMFPVAAFYAYTVWARRPLRIDIAFPALQLFGMLENSLHEIPRLITVLLNAKVAVDRIEDFMSEPDKVHSHHTVNSRGSEISLRNASFAWPSTPQPVLRDINLSFASGLTVICGKVAAGKTALLQALLGELDKIGGEVSVPDGMIAYCAQRPWLQSMSIRENILFSSPFEMARYRQVLEACALNPDLESFKHGDLSNIGENGIGLSGGQRARVALARAVYSRAKIVLLDDPLSALDHQTAESIVRKCFGGDLMAERNVILVTHRTDLCQGLASRTIEIVDGTARLVDDVSVHSPELSKIFSTDSSSNGNQQGLEDQGEGTVPEKFMEDEKRAHGGVKISVYWEYIKAGKIRWWVVLILILTIHRIVAVGETWFLKQWGEGYSRPVEHISTQPFDTLPSPENDIRPWLIGFFILAASQSTMFFVSQCSMLVIIYSAGKKMFTDIMDRVSHATFRFYDVTPIGRLMNRMTSDIGTVDGNISQQFEDVALLVIKWASSIVIIASVTPVFLIVSFVLTASFVWIFLHFLPTSQSLRRLEMVSLSPLMSNFGALLEGLTTVRAFAVQSRFQDRVIAVTDAFQKMDHFYWSLQAWLMYRFDTLSACSTFLITLLALYTAVSPGLTAFLLIAAAQFVSSTHALCQQYGQLQMDFVSVERVVELLHLEQEPKGSIQPPASWPSYTGDIVFEDVTLNYAPQLDPSLINVSLRIPGGSTTALLGRTGSGKSTLALSLLATLLPESGCIFIDNIDISKVDTQALRNRVTFLAQDPVLFPGSMRQNLDPLDEYSDDACDAVLRRICSAHQWTLETQIDTGGRNLSQGQRQLVGLARAILRRSAIVILDEATASIDKETAMTIQQVLREEMKESTVITIAHRLEAVKDADYFIKLDNGRVVAQGPPAATIGHEDG